MAFQALTKQTDMAWILNQICRWFGDGTFSFFHKKASCTDGIPGSDRHTGFPKASPLGGKEPPLFRKVSEYLGFQPSSHIDSITITTL